MDSNTKCSDVLFFCTSFLQQLIRSVGLGSRQPSSQHNQVDQEDTSYDSSVGSNSIPSNRYDVFISFRGTDVRNTFVDHLYAHLTRKGIFAFKDDTRLQKGESIPAQLKQAIKHSRVFIVVFSKDFAASTWCLDEMVAIVRCHWDRKQTIFPIFYDVDPSHVRKQDGVYKNAFLLHAEQLGLKSYKVFRWRTDMTYLANLTGWDVRDKPEFEEIKKITEAVIKKLGHRFSWSADDLIGIQSHVEELERLLKLSPKVDGSQVLGIWGMGGIGKTTLATVLCDRISDQFEACCFIKNVSKIYKDGGASAVQKQILCQTIEDKNLEAYSPTEISGIVRNRLHNIRLLLVLDSVDQYEQLHELHVSPKLLCAGSRIIITTRDEHILKEYGADTIYEAQLMNYNDARDLLCRKAFKSVYATCINASSPFVELIPEVLKYVGRLPLAIRVMGSFLCSRNAIEWRATLNGLGNNPDKRIMKVLHMSFEGLEPREREIFLHIACFFKGERVDYVRRILDACGLHPNIGLQLIAEKSLIIIRNGEIHMHEMLQELGKQIVRGNHPDEPRFWSRLWLYQDFYRVMMTKMKAKEVRAIVLDQNEDDYKFNKLNGEDLSKMEHLKMLILCHKNFSGRPTFHFNELRYFSWNGYPSTSLPSTFQPHDLVELNMPNSNIEELWGDSQYLPHLKRIDLSNSKQLKVAPSFEGIEMLERLDLTGCISLLEVHPSIGCLSKLEFMSLQGCSSLINLYFGEVSRLCSLRVLRISGCTKLQNTPDFTGASNLEYLDMDRCASLAIIHESIGTLIKLKFLSLRECTNLVRIPDNFNNTTSLTTLYLCGCLRFLNLSLRWIFDSSHIKSLTFLDLSFCYISEIPEAIGDLRCLERLNLQGNNILSIPSTVERLSSLAYLNLSHCHSLEHLPKLPKESSPSVGTYFRTTSGSRDHRSGLYIYDCPKVGLGSQMSDEDASYQFEWQQLLHKTIYEWLQRLVKEPRHFRCGFDIVLSLHLQSEKIPLWFDHRFGGSSIIRIKNSEIHADWVGFVFCIEFEVNNSLAISGSPCHPISSPLPHPFYLSFESEHTEERFDMPLSLELNKVDGSSYLWTIYISKEHCHFVKKGARISFKARHGFVTKEWGLHALNMENIKGSKWRSRTHHPLQIEKVPESSINFEPKIQLPYNWFVSKEDKAENDEAEEKELNLFI